MKFRTDKELITELLKTEQARRVQLHMIFNADTTDSALKMVKELRTHAH